MIPPTTNRSVTIGGSQSSASFAISIADSAHIMGILREGLYSDKILAILREYSSNAWDAHRSIGKHDQSILVILPTQYEPVLCIRDYGPGLSHDDVFNVYTQYGKSTKRDSDDVVGMLGIGSKSGFAYSDSFTITSWHKGTKRVYVATLGEDEKGAINLLAEEALFCECSDGEHGLSCSSLETGVEIQIATKPEDRYEFERTARRLFRHMTPRPEINIELPALPDEQTVLTNGTITPGTGEWVAVMGCVPYRINLGALDERQLNKCLPNLGGLLTFDIGEVAVSASREELKYTTATKAVLVEKFNALVDEFVTHALAQLDAGNFTGWETRLRVQVLAKLDLPLPEKWKAFAEGFAKVTYKPEDFTIIHNKSACTRLMVTTETRLLIDDTGNDLSGYHLGHNDYVVRSTGKTVADLQATLDAVLVASGLVGVTIELLSTLSYVAPVVPQKRKSNPKHRARMFQLVERNSGCAPWSDNWAAVLRVPTKDDVFVTIEGFKAAGYKSYGTGDFFNHIKDDRKLAKAFGVEMPAIYGYKTTEKKPVLAESCEGAHYLEWRKAFIQSLLTPENIALIETYWRARPTGDSYEMQLPDKKRRLKLAEELGATHPLVELCNNATTASELMPNGDDHIGTLAGRAGMEWKKSAAHAQTEALKVRYPLLRRVGFRQLWGNSSYYDDEGEAKSIRKDWADYVRLCDERIARETATLNNVVQLKSVP